MPFKLSQVDAIRTDVLVVGGGLAGHRAAVAARSAGVDVTMVYPSRGASPFIIGCNAPLAHENAADTADAYFEDMVQGGYGLNDRRLVDLLAREAADDVCELAEIGVPLAGSDGRFAQRHLSGNRYPRSVYHPNGFGAEAVGRLSQYVEEIGVRVLGSRKAVQLLYDKGEVCGALLVRRHTGETMPVLARSVVLASGGLGRIFADSTYPADISADSYALALESGATLIDMEFVQFEPTVCCFPSNLRGLEMPTAMLGDGAWLVNAAGERFMLRYNPEFAEKRMEKAKLSLCIQNEIDEGRGSPEGGVLFDMTKVPRDKLESYVAHCKRMRAAGIEPSREGVQIRPAAHSQMGGIRIDDTGWSGVPGLYAGGEAAGGVHGASRLAGNGGSDAMVFGAVAGRGAAAGLLSATERRWPAIIAQAQTALTAQKIDSSGPRPDALKADIQNIMSEAAGIYRTGDGLKKGDAALVKIGEAIASGVAVDDASDFVAAREASNMVVAGRCVIAAALARTESRGAHQRRDYPRIDDVSFLRHMAARLDGNGEIQMTTCDIA